MRSGSELTPEFGWAVGGLLEHAAAMNAFLGPTVNCAKRYRKNTYAPASVTWGFENRSVAIRVKAGRGDATHIEDRLGCAASNPYLALAGMLVAMLDGIARRIEPPPPLQDKRLPARRPRPAPAHARGLARGVRGRRRAAERIPPRVRQGVPGPQAPRDREGPRGDSRLRRRRLARPGDRLGARPVPVAGVRPRRARTS